MGESLGGSEVQPAKLRALTPGIYLKTNSKLISRKRTRWKRNSSNKRMKILYL